MQKSWLWFGMVLLLSACGEVDPRAAERAEYSGTLPKGGQLSDARYLTLETAQGLRLRSDDPVPGPHEDPDEFDLKAAELGISREDAKKRADAEHTLMTSVPEWFINDVPRDILVDFYPDMKSDPPQLVVRLSTPDPARALRRYTKDPRVRAEFARAFTVPEIAEIERVMKALQAVFPESEGSAYSSNRIGDRYVIAFRMSERALREKIGARDFPWPKPGGIVDYSFSDDRQTTGWREEASVDPALTPLFRHIEFQVPPDQERLFWSTAAMVGKLIVRDGCLFVEGRSFYGGEESSKLAVLQQHHRLEIDREGFLSLFWINESGVQRRIARIGAPINYHFTEPLPADPKALRAACGDAEAAGIDGIQAQRLSIPQETFEALNAMLENEHGDIFGFSSGWHTEGPKPEYVFWFSDIEKGKALLAEAMVPGAPLAGQIHIRKASRSRNAAAAEIAALEHAFLQAGLKVRTDYLPDNFSTPDVFIINVDADLEKLNAALSSGSLILDPKRHWLNLPEAPQIGEIDPDWPAFQDSHPDFKAVLALAKAARVRKYDESGVLVSETLRPISDHHQREAARFLIERGFDADKIERQRAGGFDPFDYYVRAPYGSADLKTALALAEGAAIVRIDKISMDEASFEDSFRTTVTYEIIEPLIGQKSVGDRLKVRYFSGREKQGSYVQMSSERSFLPALRNPLKIGDEVLLLYSEGRYSFLCRMYGKTPKPGYAAESSSSGPLAKGESHIGEVPHRTSINELKKFATDVQKARAEK